MPEVNGSANREGVAEISKIFAKMGCLKYRFEI